MRWQAAEDLAVSRSPEERARQQVKWANKKARVKTAFVKTVVKKAFGEESGRAGRVRDTMLDMLWRRRR